MIGEMEKGRSIRVKSRFFPLKSYLHKHHPVISPKIPLKKTAQKVAISVNSKAESASGEVHADQKKVMPLFNP